MSSTEVVTAAQRYVANSLPTGDIQANFIAGVIGDAPSHYSKSPILWNAAFQRVGSNAVYLPFDVGATNVGALLSIFKSSEHFLGVNVTVPHKVRVMDFLDGIDPEALRIQAVNTIVRTGEGRLVGYNTDGAGFLASLLLRQPDRAGSFVASLKGMDIILLGAGGSARAVALCVADVLDGGRILICNRTIAHASSLADDVSKRGGNAKAILESELSNYAPTVGLIVNSTTKGQGGMRKLSDNRATLLEPYSALAPADPPLFAESDFAKPDFQRRWSEAAKTDIASNNQASRNLVESIPAQTGFYDLIYHPDETLFLRHGRQTGHPTMNGKAMIVNQAAFAFCRHIGRGELAARGIDTPETHKQILEVMYGAW